MKYQLILGIVTLLVAGCINQVTGNDADPEVQMQEGMMMGSKDVFVPGQSISRRPISEVKSSTIINLKDGDLFELSADIVVGNINGKEIKMYGYNGQVPGPALRVPQNATITVQFKNNIDWNTTIHWHGLRHDIKDDGVPGVSQDPVQPGESFTYTVHFPDEGIYWYHPHIREDIQQDSGLAGNMLVEPFDETYYNPVNREELLVLDDILMDDEGVVPYGLNHANYVTMGRFGNVMLVNGQTDYKLRVSRGDVVRFYITNVANVRPYNLSFGGAKIKLIGSDIGKYEEETFVTSIIISPAQRYIVEVYFEEQGTYLIENIHPTKKYQLGTVLVSSVQSDNDYSAEFLKLGQNSEIIADIASFESYFDKEIDYTINISIDMPMELMQMMDMNDFPCHQMPSGEWMGNCGEEGVEEDHENIEWEDDMGMMNVISTSEDVTWILRDAFTGNENMDIKMKAKVGDKVKIRLFNDPDSMHPMQHPIHLHGQRFLIIAIDDEPINNRAWQDTVLIPTGKTVDILVDVTNPGEWMMHCHIAEHLEAGMMASFIVE